MAFCLLLLPRTPTSLSIPLLAMPASFPSRLRVILGLPNGDGSSTTRDPPMRLISIPSSCDVLLPSGPICPMQLRSCVLSSTSVPRLSPEGTQFLRDRVDMLLRLGPRGGSWPQSRPSRLRKRGAPLTLLLRLAPLLIRLRGPLCVTLSSLRFRERRDSLPRHSSGGPTTIFLLWGTIQAIPIPTLLLISRVLPTVRFRSFSTPSIRSSSGRSQALSSFGSSPVAVEVSYPSLVKLAIVFYIITFDSVRSPS